jgi:YggT family protein
LFLSYFLELYGMLIFIRVLMTWIPMNPHNVLFETICAITDPYLNLFRSIIPPIGMIDISPMVAMMIIFGLAQVLRTI